MMVSCVTTTLMIVLVESATMEQLALTWSMDLVAPVLVDILVDTVHKTLMNVVVSHVRMEEHV
jgi:hypothetical protein